LLNAADQVVVSDFYDKLALSRSLDEISQARRVLSTSALVKFRDSEAPVDAWEAENSLRIAQVQGQVNDLISSSDASVAKLTIAAGLITDLSRG
jgi:glutamate dehydrogenase